MDALSLTCENFVVKVAFATCLKLPGRWTDNMDRKLETIDSISNNDKKQLFKIVFMNGFREIKTTK